MELSALKQASLDAFNLWSAVGKPRSGQEFLAMKRVKAGYELAIRNKERSSQQSFSNSLNDALLGVLGDLSFAQTGVLQLLMDVVTTLALQISLHLCLNLLVSQCPPRIIKSEFSATV